MTGRKLIFCLLFAGMLYYFFAKRIMYQVLILDYLKRFEGFRENPYWDYKQWSWGYGTRVPASVNDQSQKPNGTINRAKAAIDAMVHVDRDYTELKAVVTRSLSGRQWAALLSFAYNLGVGNAMNLTADINAGNWQSLAERWIQYVNAGGVRKDFLVTRRNYEVSEFLKDV